MNYYNEYNPKTAAWLRELIRVGAIPDGHVDERSIAEVSPDDLRGFTQCHFFAGIGGWSLALQLAGWSSERPVWTGSCPCQPFSSAGKGLGAADERHLWPVFFELIRKCRPEHIFGEQVASAIGHGWLDGVSADLEAEGYACGATVLGAHSVGAPHIRQRLYWVASSIADGWKRVSFAGECFGGDGDELGDICAVCGLDYCDECQCPGPTQDGYEYDERDGILYARRVVNGIDQGPQGHIKPGNVELHAGAQQDGSTREAGFSSAWAGAKLHRCRDGKTRRVPTEPLLQRVANGIPLAVDFMRNIVGELKTQIVRHAKKTDSTAIETLREMQYAFWAEAIQWDSRGRIGLLSPEILLAALCQLERELGDFEFSSSQSIIKAQEAIMLRVRKDTPKKAATCPPSRWEYAQQLAREFADALHELSHENTLEAAQSIFDRALGFPLTTKCPARATLLRGYGNAIVPQAAAEFIAAFMDTTPSSFPA